MPEPEDHHSENEQEDTGEQDHTDTVQTDSTQDQTAVSSNYKVLGELDSGGGAGVLGQNNATRDAPIGVRGAVPNARNGYGLYTDDDAFVGGELDAPSILGETILLNDEVRVNFVGDSGDDHGVIVTDRSTSNSEQIAIRADPDGSGELVFQDTDEANYKWGLRVSDDDFYLDNHANAQTRIEANKTGPLRFRGGRVEVRDGKTEAKGSDTDGHAVDASGGSVRAAGGVVYQQRGDPTTNELQPGETMLFNSDGSGTGSAGDMVYAINDGGTIKTSLLVGRSEATE